MKNNVHILAVDKVTYSKGFIYTLEVMLAVAIMLATLVLVFSTSPEQAETSLPTIKQTGYDALFYMDQAGDLRYYVSTGALTDIKNELATILPSGIVFDASICRTSCNSTLLPGNRTTVIVDYYVGAYRGQFINKKVRLWMWEKF